ncbi:zinc-binding dehydrogenase [Escherichia coli]
MWGNWPWRYRRGIRHGARVIAIDIDDRKRNIALECGAQRFLNSQQCDVAAELVLLNDGRGPEVVIEAVGNQQTIEQATGLVAFSGRVVYVGYAKQPVSYQSAQFLMKELDIRGSRNATVADFRAVLALMESGVIRSAIW